MAKTETDAPVADETAPVVDDVAPAEIPAEEPVVLGPFDDVPDDHMRIPLAHHYQIEPGVWAEPGDQIIVPISTARSLLSAGYVAVNPTDRAAVVALFGRYA